MTSGAAVRVATGRLVKGWPFSQGTRFSTSPMRWWRLFTARRRKGAVLSTLAMAVGGSGVLGGQVDDLAAEGKRVGEKKLRSIHLRKTASLDRRLPTIGGEWEVEFCGAPHARQIRIELGLLFQIVDDLLNLEGTAEQLGRPAGGDERHRKATYPRVVGRAATRRRPHGQSAGRLRRAARGVRSMVSFVR